MSTATPSPNPGVEHDIDPQQIIDTINRIREPVDGAGNPSNNRLRTYKLPGFGEAYDGSESDVEVGCGEDVRYFCPDCGKPTSVGRCCGRSECPRCSKYWAFDSACRKSAKLAAVRDKLDADRWDHQRHHHLMVSPDDALEVDADDPNERVFQAVKEIVKQLGYGADGSPQEIQGEIYYHGYRNANEGPRGDNRGTWKDIVFSGKDWLKTFQEDLEPEPHFHIVGVCHKVAGEGVVERVEEETGWVIHRVTRGDSSISIGDHRQLAETVEYNLSHTSIKEDHDGGHNTACTRWFGSDINDIQAFDYHDDELSKFCRQVAPTVLGIPFKQLACHADVHESHKDDDTQSFDGTQAEKREEREPPGADDRRDRLVATSEVGSDGLPIDPSMDSQMRPLGGGSQLDLPTRYLDLPATYQDLPNRTDSILDNSDRTFKMLSPAGDDDGLDLDDLRFDPDSDHVELLVGREETTVRCEGGLEHISQAKDKLEDDDWVEEAPYVDELRTEYEQYQDERSSDRPPDD